jgi:hypothetical protein
VIAVRDENVTGSSEQLQPARWARQSRTAGLGLWRSGQR